MDVVFHAAAERELIAAVDYYNGIRKGLGLEFAIEAHAAVEHILAFPDAWGRLSKNTRRCLMNRFPYGVIYATARDSIVILAVMHLNRKPRYWTRRKSEAKPIIKRR